MMVTIVMKMVMMVIRTPQWSTGAGAVPREQVRLADRPALRGWTYVCVEQEGWEGLCWTTNHHFKALKVANSEHTNSQGWGTSSSHNSLLWGRCHLIASPTQVRISLYHYQRSCVYLRKQTSSAQVRTRQIGILKTCKFLCYFSFKYLLLAFVIKSI